MEQFEGRVVVITGGASGIGRELALSLGREGAHVVIGDIDEALAAQTVDEVRATGVRCIAVPTDVSERASVEALADAAYEEFGAVHLLFNNAGVAMHGWLADMTPTDWEWVFSVNIWGILNGVDTFLPRLRAQRADGDPANADLHIVNTSSLNGIIARNNAHGVYTTSKYAVVGYTYVLREELAPEGIGVSLLLPSMMDTGLMTAGRNRQDRFGGPLDQGEMPIPPRSVPADPAIMAPRVLQGIRENRRYIFTHPETKPFAEAYFQELLDDYDAAARDVAAEGAS